ncbi:MAG: hypothetical protein R2697_00350 [Ilumatobacteraceae bacterium]
MNTVVTSHAATSSTAFNRWGERSASSAPSPPSVVADPPRPTTIRLAPAVNAASISSPVPAVVAFIGSFPSAPPASSRPLANAISMIAVRPERRQAASTGRPSGPVTRVVRLGPPNTSSRPSPPSAIGTSTQSWPASQQA